MEIFRYILKSLIFVLSYVINYERYSRIKKSINSLYSYWIQLSIKHCGTEFYVESPTYFKGMEYMTIGDNFSSGERLRIECWDKYGKILFAPQLVIGNNVNMNYNVHIGCINKVVIGDNVLLGSNILITDHQHGFIDNRDFHVPPSSRQLYSKGTVIIEDDVWIGENVCIMPNICIGKGSIVGANSVVTKSCPPYSVITGAPAKIIKNLKEI